MKKPKNKLPFTTGEAVFLTICLVIPLTGVGAMTHYKFPETFLAAFFGYIIGFIIIKLWRKRNKK